MKLRDPGLVLFGGVSVTDGVCHIIVPLGFAMSGQLSFKKTKCSDTSSFYIFHYCMGQFVRIPDESLHTCS